MVFWFIGLSLWSIWFVFHDPAIDLRMAIAGAVLPGAVFFATPYTALHSVVVVSLAMGIVAAATIGRRAIRRRAIFVVFGMFLHLVFDGAWSNTHVFWWPMAGAKVISNLHVGRSLGQVALMECIGLVLTFAFAKRFEVLERGNWTYFLRTGRLNVAIDIPVHLRGARPKRTDS